jgi:hypothetical protein
MELIFSCWFGWFTYKCSDLSFLVACGDGCPNPVSAQCNETNVMHFSLNLLRIKSLYMFQALLAHPQEVLHKRHLVYCVRIMSVGCATIAVSLQSWPSHLTYARNIPSAVCVAPPEGEQVILETHDCSDGAANWHKHAIYQVPFVKRLLRMSK